MNASPIISTDHPKPRLERFVAAWKAVRFYFLVALTFGILLVFASVAYHDQFPGQEVIPKLLEHLGMGLIVAAIAVIFYEWGAHIKDALSLEDHAMLLREDSMRLSAELKAIKDAVAEHAIENALRASIHGESQEFDNEIIRNVKSFVMHLRDLQEHGDWAKHGYARYLARLLRNATENAERLSELSTKLRHDPETAPEYRIMVLSPAKLTDTLLAAQMSRLPSGGKYSIASNLGSWRGQQLESLRDASRLAVREHGVHIRRIFVVGRDSPYGDPIPITEAHDILSRHIEDASQWTDGGSGSYEVRLLDPFERSRFTRKVSAAANVLFGEHFGIFEFSEQTHCVRVQVIEPDLSGLRIGGVVPKSDGAVALQQFDEVWQVLVNLNSELLNAALDRWKSIPELLK